MSSCLQMYDAITVLAPKGNDTPAITSRLSSVVALAASVLLAAQEFVFEKSP